MNIDPSGFVVVIQLTNERRPVSVEFFIFVGLLTHYSAHEQRTLPVPLHFSTSNEASSRENLKEQSRYDLFSNACAVEKAVWIGGGPSIRNDAKRILDACGHFLFKNG